MKKRGLIESVSVIYLVYVGVNKQMDQYMDNLIGSNIEAHYIEIFHSECDDQDKAKTS